MRLRRAYRALARITAAPLRDGSANRFRIPAALLGVALLAAIVLDLGDLRGGGTNDAGVAAAPERPDRQPDAPAARRSPPRHPRPPRPRNPHPRPPLTRRRSPRPSRPQRQRPNRLRSPRRCPARPAADRPILTWVWHFGTDGPAQQSHRARRQPRRGDHENARRNRLDVEMGPLAGRGDGPERVADLQRTSRRMACRSTPTPS